jgi:hypothetical protein
MTNITTPSSASWPCPAYPAPATTDLVEQYRRASLSTMAESLLLDFLVRLAKQQSFPAAQPIPQLGPDVLVVPWKRCGRVWIDRRPLWENDFDRVWRHNDRLLVARLGPWSAAVVAVNPGSTAYVPSLPVTSFRASSDFVGHTK